MSFRIRPPRGRAASAFWFAALTLLTGCQSRGDAVGGQEAAESKVSQTELRAYCPPVAVREGTAFFSTYEGGAPGDASRIVQQASIADVTRACTRENGMLSVKVAVAGRVVPGPLAKAGTVTMPIRVVATRGDEVLYSQLHRHQVEVASTAQATQFLFTDPAVSIPEEAAQGARIYAGFDEGPAKTAAPD